MSKLTKVVGTLALAAVAALLGLSALVFIQPAEAAASVSATAHRGGRGYCGEAGLEAAAQALGMTADELSTQLWGGESLADLADEAGVDLEDVQAAVDAACQQATRDAIEQAVTDGTLTREHADWLLEGLEKGFWGGNGGMGFGGPGGFGRHGHFGVPPVPGDSEDASGTNLPGIRSGYGRSALSDTITVLPGSDA
jgi:hypothetical protein